MRRAVLNNHGDGKFTLDIYDENVVKHPAFCVNSAESAKAALRLLEITPDRPIQERFWTSETPWVWPLVSNT